MPTLDPNAVTAEQPEAAKAAAQTLTATAPSEGVAPGPSPVVDGYLILGELGHGGMGVVYEAIQTSLNRHVALKMLLAGKFSTTAALVRFMVEAEMLARLRHPNIVQIHEVGKQDGWPYVALEFVDGGTLADKAAKNPPDARTAAAVVEVLARAVQHAHAHGVIHRDLKPLNILLQKVDGGSASSTPGSSCMWGSETVVPKVSDFGLAKADNGGNGMTATGAVLGTPSYMAPEQASGTHQVGPAADVYALGAMLYDLLTGRPPFRGETPAATIQQLLHDQPLPARKVNPKVPRDLEVICEKCLEKNPGGRYASADAVANDLNRYLTGRPITARAVGTPERVWRWGRRNPAVAGLLAGLAAVLLIGAAGITWKWREAELARDAADANARTAANNARDAEANAARATAALVLSEENFTLAQDAVEKYLTTVSDSEALKDPALTETRKQLIQNAREFYEKFISLKADDPASRVKLGTAYGRLAEIAANADGDAAACAANAEKSRAVFADLLAADPAAPAHLRGAAYADYAAAHALFMQDRPAAASLLLGRALDRQRSIATADGPDRERFARLLNYAGADLMARKRYVEAAPLYREFVRVADLLRDARPTVDLFDDYAGFGRFKYAVCLRRTGDPAADPLFAEVEARYRVRATNRPNDPEPDSWLGWTALNRGYIAEAKTDWPAAAGQFTAAQAAFKKYLARRNSATVRQDAAAASFHAAAAEANRGRFLTVEPHVRTGFGFGPADVQSHVLALKALADAADLAAADTGSDPAARANRRAHLLEYGGWVLSGLKGSAPADAATGVALSRYFATWPDPPFRDPARAILLAKRASEKSPGGAAAVIALGIAHFAAGDDTAAETVLTASAVLPGGDTAEARFYRAAAAARRGEKAAAEAHYLAASGPAPAAAKLAADVALGRARAPDAPPKPTYDAVAGADLPAFKAWLDGLPARGFFPVQVNAHETAAGPRFAAVAVNDGARRTWDVFFDPGVDGFQRRFNRQGSEGFSVTGLCGYADGGRPMFLSVWSNRTLGFSECRHAVSPEYFPAAAKKNRGAGSRPVSVSAFLLDGRPQLTTVYGVDQGFDSDVHDGLTPEQFADLLKARRPSGWKPGPVGIVKYNGQPRITATLVNDPQTEWDADLALPAAEYRAAVATRAAAGYRPEQVVGYDAAAGSRYLAVWVRAAAPLPGPTPRPITGTAVPELAAFDTAVLRFMTDRDIPAGTLAVMKDGKLVLSRGYGHRDRDRIMSVPPDTPFRLASVTKPVTAAAVRQLIAAGKFTEETKVANYLGLKPPAGGTMDPRWAEVTVGQLLRHRGGFDRDKAGDPMFQTGEVGKALGLREPPTPQDVLKYMAGRPLQFDPNQKVSYSNFGYCVLGRVIEKATGKTYLAYVQQDVLKPHGITGFALGRTLPADRDPREPFYSDPFRGKDVMHPAGEPAPVPAPDGGFHLEMMDSHGGLIAPAPAVVAFLAKFRVDGRPAAADSPPDAHTGSLPGTYTLAARRPNGVVLAVLFNQRSDASGRGYDEIFEMLSKVAAGVESWPAR